MPTDRELASLILLGVGLLVILIVPKLRRALGPSFLNVLRIIVTSPALLTVWGLFLVWCATWVTLAILLRAWDVGLLSDTLIIVFTVGFPLLYRAVQAKSGNEIWHRIGSETIAASAFLVFYINLEPFPLLVELWVQPVIAIIALTEVVARREEKNRRFAGCLRVLLGLAGLAIIVWSTVQFIIGAPTRDWLQFFLQLALTVWLPVVMFPFFYFASFYAAAQKITRRLRRIYKPPALRRVTVAVALGLHLRLKWARAFGHPYEKQILRAKGFREAVGLMRDFRDDIGRREELEVERLANLDAFAGQVGADGSGAQLDRREFEGTKRALEFLVIAQGLRYAQLGNRYWNDLTETVLRPVDRYDLPTDHGITVETTDDGQRWRAWRRMPSGWHLGIGGRDGQPGHFLYTAPDSPTSWPGDEGWADATWDLELPEDWTRDDHAVI
jgi:hypothetical protein